MATLSVRTIAEACLDVDAPLSVKRDVFGYIHGPIDRTLSLKSHLQRISGTACNLSIFLVGHEPGYTGWFTQDEARQTQHAVDVTRELYSQVGLGVRKLYWRYIPTDEAAGYMSVDGPQATDLTEQFSGPNDGIDVFYVNLIVDALGWSNSGGGEGGPCDKDEKGERTGAIVEIRRPETNANSLQFAGILLAHEVGHYLGLVHAMDGTNVMGNDSNGDGKGEITLASVNLTASQGDTMKASCFVHEPCAEG